jgi:thymidine kinase
MFHMAQETGWIEVVTGCMYSGKTEELNRRVRRAQYAKQPIRVFKPAVDNRYSDNEAVSHSGSRVEAVSVSQTSDIWDRSKGFDVIAIDEAQFFDESLVEVCQHLADSGKRVIVAGLDLDFRGVPFGCIPRLLAVAEQVTKLHAVCVQCGNHASRSQRIVDAPQQVLVGGESAYEARCRKCWSPEPVFTKQENMAEMEG